jgi:tetratricopeptide (TPR) repeat protein
MLVPVLGIVQVGIQAHADRYNYLPQIGLCLIVAWGIDDLTKAWRYQRVVVGALGVTTVIGLIWPARLQTSYWSDSQSLWEHALAATSDNEMAREHLSDAYLDKGRINDAIAQAREAVKLLPDSADARGVLGAALARTPQLNEAISHLQSAIQLNPKLPRAHFNLGNVFLQQGDVEQAIANYESEVELYPNFSQGHNNLGNALLRAGKTDKALTHLRLALELNPNYPEAHNNLAIALSQTGGVQQAINEWEKTLRIDSKNLEAQCNLAWVLSTFSDPSVRNGPRAVELAERAIDLSGGKNARIWRLAAAAYAEAGRFPEAIKAAQNGIYIAKSQGNFALVETLESNIRLFEQNSPLRDSGSAGGPSSR